MLFLAPGQVMGSEDDGQLHQPEGWVVAFHPEFLRGTPLAHIMKDYSYFLTMPTKPCTFPNKKDGRL